METVELGEYVNILSGYAFDSKSFNSEENGLPLIRIRDVGKNKSETFYSGDFNEKYLVKSGDYLIGMDGDFRIAEWKGEDALLNQRVCKISSGDSQILDKKYLYYSLPKKLKEIEDATSFATVKHLSVKKINKIEIPLPPLKTQQKIVAVLDEADRLRQLDKQLIQKYEELSQSLFLEMFGDPVSNPKGWKFQTVNDFATIVRGSSPRPKGDPRYYGEGVPRLMVADLTRDGLFVTPIIDSLTLEGSKKSRPMKKGDLVMAVSGKPGLPAILEVDCCIHDGFAGFRDISEDYNKVFLYFYFWKYISEVNKRSVGAIFKNITTNDIREIKVPIVSIEFQNKFAKSIEALFEQKKAAEKSLLIAEELFNNLLHKAFKGELV